MAKTGLQLEATAIWLPPMGMYVEVVVWTKIIVLCNSVNLNDKETTLLLPVIMCVYVLALNIQPVLMLYSVEVQANCYDGCHVVQILYCPGSERFLVGAKT